MRYFITEIGRDTEEIEHSEAIHYRSAFASLTGRDKRAVHDLRAHVNRFGHPVHIRLGDSRELIVSPNKAMPPR